MNKKNIAIESAVIVDIHQESEKGFVRINGTYLSPEEKYYVLKYKIPFSGKDQFHYANISTFIREYYLPKIQRERMSSKLLEEINQRIANLMLDVVTQDFDEYGAVSINATYLPLGFDSWEEYLKTIFKIMRRKYKNSICVCFSLTIRKHAALPVILNLKSWNKSI